MFQFIDNAITETIGAAIGNQTFTYIVKQNYYDCIGLFFSDPRNRGGDILSVRVGTETVYELNGLPQDINKARYYDTNKNLVLFNAKAGDVITIDYFSDNSSSALFNVSFIYAKEIPQHYRYIEMVNYVNTDVGGNYSFEYLAKRHKGNLTKIFALVGGMIGNNTELNVSVNGVKLVQGNPINMADNDDAAEIYSNAIELDQKENSEVSINYSFTLPTPRTLSLLYCYA